MLFTPIFHGGITLIGSILFSNIQITISSRSLTTGKADACSFLCSKIEGGCSAPQPIPQCGTDKFCRNVYEDTSGAIRLNDDGSVPDGGNAISCSLAEDRKGSSLQPWKEWSPYAKGLGNLGVSCYMNTFLQVLLHTTSIRPYMRYIKQWVAQVDANAECVSLIRLEERSQRHLDTLKDFINLYDYMFDPKPSFENPIDKSKWYTPMTPDHLLTESWGVYAEYARRQEDSGQAFGRFLNDLVEPAGSQLFANARNYVDPPYEDNKHGIGAYFKIQYSESDKCECGEVHAKQGQTQLVYTLNFPPSVIDLYKAALIYKIPMIGSPKPVVNLAAMIWATLPQNELVDDLVECPVRIGERLARIRSVRFIDPSPKVLVFAFGRVVATHFKKDFDPEKLVYLKALLGLNKGVAPQPAGFYQGKIDAQVEFPEELDFSKVPKSDASGKYKLVGIGIHSGGHAGGHYVGAFFDKKTRQWLLANDRSVTQTTLAEIRDNKHNTPSFVVYEKITKTRRVTKPKTSPIDENDNSANIAMLSLPVMSIMLLQLLM